VSYEAQHALTYDPAWNNRWRACLTQQANGFRSDSRADVAALSESILRGDNGSVLLTFQTSLGAAPGLADKADNGDGTVDSSRISDAEILSNVQAQYPSIASLYFLDTGEPVP